MVYQFGNRGNFIDVCKALFEQMFSAISLLFPPTRLINIRSRNGMPRRYHG